MRGGTLPNKDGDLEHLLQGALRRIRTLEERSMQAVPGTADVLSTWVPVVRATTTAPRTVDIAQGFYMLTNIIGVGGWAQCSGSAVVRYKAPFNRGSGIYYVDLPFTPALPKFGDIAFDAFYKIGTVTLGFTDGVGTHRSALSLHRNGSTGAGAASGKKRAGIIATNQDWPFVDEDHPKLGDDIGNIHWQFNYPIIRPDNLV